MSGSDRVHALAQRTYLILFWVGFFALFKGIMQIVLAFGVRRAGKEAEVASAMAYTDSRTRRLLRPAGRRDGGGRAMIRSCWRALPASIDLTNRVA